MKPPRMFRLARAFAFCAALLSLHMASQAQPAILLDDAFADGRRAAPRTTDRREVFPLSGWFVNDNSQPASVSAASGALRFPSAGRAVACFEPVTLGVGESLVLSLDFAVTTTQNNNFGIRFGLFDSRGTRTTADGQTGAAGNRMDDRGVFVTANPGGWMGAHSLNLRGTPATQADILAGEMNLKIGALAARPDQNAINHATLTLVLEDENTLKATLSILGDAGDPKPVAAAFSATIPGTSEAFTRTFDTVALMFSDGVRGVYDNVHVAHVTEAPLVWAHYVPWHTPLNASMAAYSYYNYPVFRPTGGNRADWAEEFRQAKAQGIDGFLVDVVFKPSGRPDYADSVRKMLQAAEGTDFRVGLCLDVKTTVATQVAELARMLDEFGSHPNYPRSEGRPVVATYTWQGWTPAEWAEIRAGLLAAGQDVYLIANLDRGYTRPTEADIAAYAGHFDMAYSFVNAGINGMSREAMADLIAETSVSHGKSYMAGLYPGYYGAWLNGRNDFYQPHRGFDQLHDTFLAVRPARDRWMHFTSWNDHDETSLLPALFTPANPLITRAYSDAFKNLPPASALPEVCLAYHRETIPGTLLRIEAMSLPARVQDAVTVSGELLDNSGQIVATLAPRTLAADLFDRTEWLVPTIALAKTPALTPRITVACRDYSRTVSLPPILLVNGWHLNPVTVKVPVGRHVDFHNTLSVLKGGTDGHLLDFEINYDTALPGAFGGGEAGETITGITLFRNDRPLAVFNPQTEGRALLNLCLSASADWTMTISNGALLKATRKFSENGTTGFSWNAHGAQASGNQTWMLTGLLCSVGPDTSLVFTRAGRPPVTLTADALARQGGLTLDGLRVTVAALDMSAQKYAALDPEERGSRRLSVMLARAVRATDLFYVRYETSAGRTALSPVAWPFAPDGGALPVKLVQTTINLETSSGSSGMPHENEYLTPRHLLPLGPTSVSETLIPRESVRAARWTFDQGGRDSLGELDVTIPDAMLVPGENGQGKALKLDGTGPLKMRLRTWPIGNTTIDFRMKPDAGATQIQSVIGRGGWSDATSVNLLPDGRLQVVRDGNRDVRSELVPTETLVAQTPVAFGQWTRVRVTNDSVTLRLYLDGQLDAEFPLRPGRSYGNSTWHVGGGHGGHANYKGEIDDLTVVGAAFAPGDPRFPAPSASLLPEPPVPVATIGHWRFDALQNGVFPDLAGLNPPALHTTAPAGAAPVFAGAPFAGCDRAIALDGTGGHWLRTPFASLQNRSALTIELWVKWDGPTASSQQLILGNMGGVILSIKQGGVVSAMMAGWTAGQPGWAYAELPERVVAGEWTHLMLRHADGSFQLGMAGRGWRGERVVTSPVAKIPGVPNYPWSQTVLGLNPAGNASPFNGRIAAVKLHDTVLDDAAFIKSRP